MECQFKKGNIPPEFLDFVQENENEVLFVTAEIESPHVRLRGAFHAVLTSWFNSQMCSCLWNGQPIRTFNGLKNYYKYHGCQGKNVTYSFGGETTKDLSFFTDNLPEKYHRFIVKTARPWEKMTRKQKSRALNIMLTEIKLCDDLPKDLEKSISILENDVEALLSIGYYQHAKQFVKEKRL